MALASAGTLGLALAARGLIVSAQEASPEATPYPMTDHPLIGVWQWADPTDPKNIYAYAICSEEGYYTEGVWEFFGSILLPLGTWRATGERTAEAVFVQQALVPRDLFDPAQVMEGNTFAPPDSANLSIWRLALTVDATGNGLTQTGGFEAFNAAGEVIHTQTFDGIGTRLVRASAAEGATPVS
jgi:hypothetical protein